MTEGSTQKYDPETGLPCDKSYLEVDLPDVLQASIDRMQKQWKLRDAGIRTDDWDLDYCELQSDINVYEVEQIITSEQAWHLREKYLRMERWW